MTLNRSCLQFLAMWAVVGSLTLCVGAGTTGCGPSTPPPTPPPAETPEAPPPPPPMQEANQAQEPTAAEVAAARPKLAVDPFTIPSLKNGGPRTGVGLTNQPSHNTHGLAKNGKEGKGTKNSGEAKNAATPPPPPTPPNFQAVGIFGGSHGPVAILAPSSKGSSTTGASPGTIIVETGTKLDDGGYVKAIDPASRKVVIDKQNTDFVLPLEAPAGVSSPSAK